MTAKASDENCETDGKHYSICNGWCLWLACLSFIVIGKQIWTIGEYSVDASSNLTARFLVDLNAAPATELQALPEVGSALASRIVDYREEHGPFTSLDDVTHVPGVGPKTLELLRPMLTISPTPSTNEEHP